MLLKIFSLIVQQIMSLGSAKVHPSAEGYIVRGGVTPTVSSPPSPARSSLDIFKNITQNAWTSTSTPKPPSTEIQSPASGIPKPAKEKTKIIDETLLRTIEFVPNLALPLLNRYFHSHAVEKIAEFIHRYFIVPNDIPPDVKMHSTFIKNRSRDPTYLSEAGVEESTQDNNHPETHICASLPTYYQIKMRNLQRLPSYYYIEAKNHSQAHIRANLPLYYQMIVDHYLKTRVQLLKKIDYTSHCPPPRYLSLYPDLAPYPAKTVPLGIFNTFGDLPFFETSWSEKTLKERKADLKSYDGLIWWQLRYFLSLNNPIARLKLSLEETQTSLRDDPQYLSHLVRCIFDQIHFEAAKTPSYPTLYYRVCSLLPIFSGKECDEKLSFEDCHYALVIHIHTILTRSDKEKEIHKYCLELINAMLNTMKSKNKNFSALIRHLQTLLSENSRPNLIAKMQTMHTVKHVCSAHLKQNFLAVRNVLGSHFPEFVQGSSCCIIC